MWTGLAHACILLSGCVTFALYPTLAELGNTNVVVSYLMISPRRPSSIQQSKNLWQLVGNLCPDEKFVRRA
jgi:hypothetical protein